MTTYYKAKSQMHVRITFKDWCDNAHCLDAKSDEFGVLHYSLSSGYGHGGTPLATDNLGRDAVRQLPQTADEVRNDGTTLAARLIALLVKNKEKEVQLQFARTIKLTNGKESK